MMNELLDLEISLNTVIDECKALALQEVDEKRRAHIKGRIAAYSIVKNSVVERLSKPKEGMTINEAAEIMNQHNGSIRRKCWPERWHLTLAYDTRLDCILLFDGDTNEFRPYHFEMIDLLASDWEEY